MAKNYIAWAHDFLRAMYPALERKKYALSLVAYDEYDKPETLARSFKLDVGEGPKYKYDIIVGGYPGFTKPPKDFRPGPQYFKQFLSSTFSFDSHDWLVVFAADGPAIGNPEAQEQFGEFAAAHPDLTDDLVLAELERGGAKCGPKDSEQFMRSFSTRPFARFLGQFELISAEFKVASPYAGISVVRVWEAMAKARQADGATLTYKLGFEQFNGDLFSIETVPHRLARWPEK